MRGSMQTDERDSEATVAFRTSHAIKHFIGAAAFKRQVLPSDWLRSAVERALEDEFGKLPSGRHAWSPEEHSAARYAAKQLPAEDEEP